MKPKLERYEREEEEIEADYNAGLISKREYDRAIKELWEDYEDSVQEFVDDEYLQY